jgi:hypothetical protein
LQNVFGNYRHNALDDRSIRKTTVSSCGICAIGETLFFRPDRSSTEQPHSPSFPSITSVQVPAEPQPCTFIEVVVPGEVQERTYAEVIARRVLEAAKGNLRAAGELADRTEGRVRSDYDPGVPATDFLCLQAQRQVDKQCQSQVSSRLLHREDLVCLDSWDI